MPSQQRQAIEQIRNEHERRLQQLEIKAAKLGLSTPPEIHIEMDDIRAAIDRLNAQLDTLLPPGAIHIDLLTFPGQASHDPAHIVLDWVSDFTPDFPTPETWDSKLVPDLGRVLNECGAQRSRLIALHAKARISAGVAFGYTFREPTGYQLWIEQRPNEWWRTSAQPSEDTPLNVQHFELDARQPDTTLEIGLPQDVHNEVAEYIAAHQLPIGMRVQCWLPAIPGVVRDEAHAVAIAQQVRREIVAARRRTRRQTIHLFAAVPIGLAVLIGTQLNACEPVRCYEFDRTQQVYVPAVLLRS